VGEPELNVQVPPGPEIRHGVGLHLQVRLRRDVGRHDVLGDGVDQAVLVAEQPVDRRSLDTGHLGDPASGHRPGAVVAQEPRGGVDDARPDVVAGPGRGYLGHISMLTVSCYRRSIGENVV